MACARFRLGTLRPEALQTPLGRLSPVAIASRSFSQQAVPDVQKSFAPEVYPDENRKGDPLFTARAILGRFPGFTAENKASSVLVIASLLAAMLSKEIYIVTEESGEIYSYVVACYLWYKFLGSSLRDFAMKHKQNITSFLNDIKEKHKEYFSSRVEENNRILELPNVVKSLHQMSRDMVKMRAEIHKLKMYNNMKNNVTNWLNSHCAYELALRNSIQSNIVAKVMDSVNRSLAQPTFQDEILKDSLLTLEELTTKNDGMYLEDR